MPRRQNAHRESSDEYVDRLIAMVEESDCAALREVAARYKRRVQAMDRANTGDSPTMKAAPVLNDEEFDRKTERRNDHTG